MDVYVGVQSGTPGYGVRTGVSRSIVQSRGEGLRSVRGCLGPRSDWGCSPEETRGPIKGIEIRVSWVPRSG